MMNSCKPLQIFATVLCMLLLSACPRQVPVDPADTSPPSIQLTLFIPAASAESNPQLISITQDTSIAIRANDDFSLIATASDDHGIQNILSHVSWKISCLKDNQISDHFRDHSYSEAGAAQNGTGPASRIIVIPLQGVSVGGSLVSDCQSPSTFALAQTLIRVNARNYAGLSTHSQSVTVSYIQP